MGGFWSGCRAAGNSERAVAEVVEGDVSPSFLSDDIQSRSTSRSTVAPVTWSELIGPEGWTNDAKKKVWYRQLDDLKPWDNDGL